MMQYGRGLGGSHCLRLPLVRLKRVTGTAVPMAFEKFPPDPPGTPIRSRPPRSPEFGASGWNASEGRGRIPEERCSIPLTRHEREAQFPVPAGERHIFVGDCEAGTANSFKRFSSLTRKEPCQCDQP